MYLNQDILDLLDRFGFVEIPGTPGIFELQTYDSWATVAIVDFTGNPKGDLRARYKPSPEIEPYVWEEAENYWELEVLRQFEKARDEILNGECYQTLISEGEHAPLHDDKAGGTPPTVTPIQPLSQPPAPLFIELKIVVHSFN